MTNSEVIDGWVGDAATEEERAEADRPQQLGESETLEFKRSTAELKRAGETLCAFLNDEGARC